MGIAGGCGTGETTLGVVMHIAFCGMCGCGSELAGGSYRQVLPALTPAPIPTPFTQAGAIPCEEVCSCGGGWLLAPRRGCAEGAQPKAVCGGCGAHGGAPGGTPRAVGPCAGGGSKGCPCCAASFSHLSVGQEESHPVEVSRSALRRMGLWPGAAPRLPPGLCRPCRVNLPGTILYPKEIALSFYSILIHSRKSITRV